MSGLVASGGAWVLPRVAIRGAKPHRSRCCLIFSALVSPALARNAARTCGEKRVSHERVRPREGARLLADAGGGHALLGRQIRGEAQAIAVKLRASRRVRRKSANTLRRCDAP